MEKETQVIDAEILNRTINRMAHEILERNKDTGNLVIVGIQTRGYYFAQRLSQKIKEIIGQDLPLGALDITLYRDDTSSGIKNPIVKKTDISFDIQDKKVILVDEVIFTGRTIRAALDALIDFGRPRGIQLAVMVDRGHRELPIKPDYVGKNVPTSLEEKIIVRFAELDGKDEIIIVRSEA
ncbi:MAG: bifunctional pyr operon transcriptional regulator/uracil phosphoribosyltransferase PyrR [bacterium]|nr:bifunctional pyr operon transcriptional regulator/uracil phosphoribosyltransferase PyrR [bacterium]